MRSGIKKSKSKYWKGKRASLRDSLNRYIVTSVALERFICLTIQRGEAACQTNLLMAKFCADEARIDFLRDIPFRVALRYFCSNASAEVSQIR